MIWAIVSSWSQFLSHYLISTPALSTQHWETAENMGMWEQGQTGWPKTTLRSLAKWLTSPRSQFPHLENGNNSKYHCRRLLWGTSEMGQNLALTGHRSQDKWLIFTSLQSTKLYRILEVTEGRSFQTTLRRCSGTHVSSSPQENASECMGSHLRFHLLPRNITPQSHLCLWGKIENPTNYF